MITFFYSIEVDAVIRESGNVGAIDLGIDGDCDLPVVANAIVTRRRGEAPSWEPFTGDQISVWGPVTDTDGRRPTGPANHVQPISEA